MVIHLLLGILLLIALAPTSAWTLPCLPHRHSTTRLYNTGGWGIGPQRELTPEEFAGRGERRAFEGYQLKNQGEFLQQLSDEKDQFKKDELAEIMNVARMAGIQVDEVKKRSNKFGADVLEDEDDLDVSVQWDDVE